GMAEYLKKPVRDALDDIKERMKDRKNQKRMRLDRITNNSKKMKSLEENNKALAQALQEEKLKLRDAEATILNLKKDYQDLKFQMFKLQRHLRLKQAQGLVETCEESDSAVSSNKIVPDKGNYMKVPDIMENVSSSIEDGFGNVLPKNASFGNCYAKLRNYNEHYTGVLNNSEAPASTKKLSELDEVRLEESLDMGTVEDRNLDIPQLNENELVLRKTGSETAQSHLNSNSDVKQDKCKNREDSQVRKEKHQKAKLEKPKKTSRQAPKQRQGKGASEKKLDFLGGFSDAYNFHLEECVHLTPFRQNKVNDTDTGVDDENGLSETNTIESSDIEEDSDDSLYEPYKSKSKRRSSVNKIDTSPVHARPRSKRCLAQREQKLHDEKESESNKSSDKSIRQPSEPSHGHLCDVTNTTSLLTSTGNAAVVPEGEGSRSPKRKRSCTITVCYKEPSIAGKLRRGDPFTDTNFLNSPIYKQKNNAKHLSLQKKSLSKYNEKFVGCR
uniref:Shugoshin 1 n=1 Tax=Amazona collaria TaxID=241587 RepID=A0A8B9FZQ6_9PSIT